MQSRREFLQNVQCIGLTLTIPSLLRAAAATEKRPNILWITSEDNSAMLGCYGDSQAHTPALDALAAEGVRFTHAFANSPVCSAARSTLIMGMHNITLGLHHHRSKYRVPERFKPYPEYLRAAGYYCTNCAKTDYNFVRDRAACWDACNRKAHYKNRKPGQPFFAVFNIGESHEGQIQPKLMAKRREKGARPPTPRVPPEKIKLPPYHPDVPETRLDWSNYYDNVTAMDEQVARRLKELDDAGLAEDTIVFYYADHGGILPRSKRYVNETGTHVPMIIRVPKKWQHLCPAKPGETFERPVAFVDLPPTLLSLAGAPIPEHMQGQAFLGPAATPEPDHVFLYRGRMDARYDMVRAIRDKRYRYIKNYAPHRPYGQIYTYPFKVLPSMGAWYRAYKDGKCNAVQAAFWESKPPEELYDTQSDPWEVKNLAADPAYAERLAAMRDACSRDILDARDVGFIPESMFAELTSEQTLYDYTHSDAYPLERIKQVADIATSRDAGKLPQLIAAMSDAHPVVRYWATTGCCVLAVDAAPAKDALTKLLADSSHAVRIAAAEALGHIGDKTRAETALAAEIQNDDDFRVLQALTALENIDAALVPLRERLEHIKRTRKVFHNSWRVAGVLLDRLAPAAK